MFITKLKDAYWRKPTKTISGVTPLAVVIAPRPCRHGTCLYCPSLSVPQSYTPASPAIMRAVMLDYDPYKQVKARLKAFRAMKHPTDKIELIILGGTFLAYPLEYQYNFIKRCYDALNRKTAKSLDEAKKINEKARHRCVALCIETRPDVCGEQEIKRMLLFGTTRCELGVQALDNKIYKKINRGHTIADVVKATKLLRDAGFKIGYHIMPNLPGSSIRKDLALFKKLFSDPRFRPDQLKIYPTQVVKGSKLVQLYESNKYRPYSDDELINLLIKMKMAVPEYCRIMRVMREIPPDYLIAGTKRIDLRKILDEKLRQSGKSCRCIRCREVGFALREGKKINREVKLTKKEYSAAAAGGKEIFLSFVNCDDIIFGLCRLRICGKEAFIRELHVFGPQVNIGKFAEEKYQHRGLGKALMQEAERAANKHKCEKIKVISGVGVRDYYRALGYELEDNYMIKKI